MLYNISNKWLRHQHIHQCDALTVLRGVRVEKELDLLPLMTYIISPCFKN